MPRVEFVGQSTRDSATRAASPSRLVNLYREPSGEGMMLRAVPGMTGWADTGTSLMRDMAVSGDALYAVCGGNLWKIPAAGGTALDLGQVGFDPEASISTNAGTVLAAASGKLWLWDGTALTEKTGLPFSDIASVDYIGGYSVVAEQGGRQFAWSDLSDPTTWPGLNFATADITDEAIVRLFVVADTLFIFGAQTVERWALTGQADENAIARIGGGAVDVGLLSARCICRVPGGMAFVASNGTVVLWIGGPNVISTAAVNAAIWGETPSTVFYYEDRGHGFVVVSFKSRPAWVYDMATTEWHERAEGREGAWQARRAVFFDGHWRLGDDLGRIGLPMTLRADYGAPLVRRAISRRVSFDAMRSLALVEAFPRVGVDKESNASEAIMAPGFGGDALSIDTPSEPLLSAGLWDSGPAQMGLRVSKDGGMTFGKDRLRPLGETGRYDKRITWRALGAMRSAVMEFSTAATDEVPMLAEVNVEVG